MYSLKFEMIIQVLQQFGSTGEFRAYISPHPTLREGGAAVLIVQNGTITSCIILNRNGQKIYHDVEAGRLLSRLGVLDWQLAPSTPIAPEPVKDIGLALAPHPASIWASYPRHCPIPQFQMRTWTVIQRSVYFLADGKHSIEQIAALLSRPSHIIEQILRDLQAFSAIE